MFSPKIKELLGAHFPDIPITLESPKNAHEVKEMLYLKDEILHMNNSYLFTSYISQLPNKVQKTHHLLKVQKIHWQLKKCHTYKTEFQNQGIVKCTLRSYPNYYRKFKKSIGS